MLSDILYGFYINLLFISLVINIFDYLKYKEKVNTVCKEVLRKSEVLKKFKEFINKEFNELNDSD